MSATPSPCPICGSDFCCCLEHLFPDLGNEPFRKKAGPTRTPESVTASPIRMQYQQGQAEPGHQRYENGQAEPQVKLGPAFTEEESADLLEGVGPGRTSLGQTKRASLLEAASNILIGFWVSVGANMLVLPHFKNPGAFTEAFLIGLIFTIISFIRSYLLRRLFNLFHIRTNRRSPWKP